MLNSSAGAKSHDHSSQLSEILDLEQLLPHGDEPNWLYACPRLRDDKLPCMEQLPRSDDCLVTPEAKRSLLKKLERLEKERRSTREAKSSDDQVCPIANGSHNVTSPTRLNLSSDLKDVQILASLQEDDLRHNLENLKISKRRSSNSVAKARDGQPSPIVNNGLEMLAIIRRCSPTSSDSDRSCCPAAVGAPAAASSATTRSDRRKRHGLQKSLPNLSTNRLHEPVGRRPNTAAFGNRAQVSDVQIGDLKKSYSTLESRPTSVRPNQSNFKTGIPVLRHVTRKNDKSQTRR